MKEFNWAQDKINALTETEPQELHESQLKDAQQAFQHLNREQRRDIERHERRMQKKMAKL